MDILIKYFNPEMPKIEKINVGDWIDLRVDHLSINGDRIEWQNGDKIFYSNGSLVLIHTGIAIQLPKGYEAHVAPRGSTFKKFGLIQTNSVGVIDESYCGDNDQWFVPMFALNSCVINRYERVAQFRIMEKMPKLNFIEVETLENQDRGGYGSTGYN